MGEWISINEACELAGFSDGYIRRMLITGGFADLLENKDYYKTGKVWIISKEAWIKHLEAYPPTKRSKNYKLRKEAW